MPTSRSVERRIAVTLGDAAGIGPEVTVKALHRSAPAIRRRVLVLGPASLFNAVSKKLRLSVRFGDVRAPRESCRDPRSVACFFNEKVPPKLVRGRANGRLATLAMRSVELSVKLAMNGTVRAIVTAPINKAAVNRAGFNTPGHTEYLAELSRTKDYEMMLVGGPLRVLPVTRHVAIKDVAGRLTRARVESAVRIADVELRRSFGVKRPRIVVCGLNPHAGEQGRFGREEIRVIAPAVRAARKKTRARIIGPLSPDALFHDAYLGRYDAEICMYHDQGLIPLKMISRGHGVNVTLGLPFVRTSPDHGTAYDIARKFTADPGSMIEAVKLAGTLLENRLRYDRAHPRR